MYPVRQYLCFTQLIGMLSFFMAPSIVAGPAWKFVLAEHQHLSARV